MMRDERTSDALRDALHGEMAGVDPQRVAILCVGNTARGDDGFGPAVAREVAGRVAARVFDAGTVPENDLPRIAATEPEIVLLVDAVHFDGAPGELRLLPPSGLAGGNVSTHAASLSLLEEYLSAACGARMLLLAAQPLALDMGAELSPPMQRVVERAAELLIDVLGNTSERAPAK